MPCLMVGGCARALDLLALFGGPIELVASKYAQFKKKLPNVPLDRVVEYYVQRHRDNITPKMVRDRMVF